MPRGAQPQSALSVAPSRVVRDTEPAPQLRTAPLGVTFYQLAQNQQMAAWQKHYFHGTDATGQRLDTTHHTRIVTPPIRDDRGDPHRER